MMKKNEYDDDDGRIVSDMSDLDNYHGFRLGIIRPNNRFINPTKKKRDVSKIDEETNSDFVPEPELELTRQERWHLALNAMLAALAVGGVFILALFLFIMFCLHIWFK
jgi:hypothetical protein